MTEKTCPLWRGKCREHKCRWYIQVQGQHPQTGAKISEWGCAVEWLPVLLIENAQQSRQTGAAVETFRNEMVNANAVLGVMSQIENRRDEPPQLTHE